MPTRYAPDGSRTVVASSAPRMAGLFRPPMAGDDDGGTSEYIVQHIE